MSLKEKRRRAALIGLRSVCSAVFILISVFSVGARAGSAIRENGGVFSDFIKPDTDAADTQKPDAPEEEHNTPSPPSTDDADADKSEEGQKIVPVELSYSDGSGEILFKNETDYTFDTGALLGAGYPIEPVSGDQPSVLILHTHATESYAQEKASTVTDTRSDNPEQNMIAVGKALSDSLAKGGVQAVHCTRMHDAASYNDAYDSSRKSVEEYLEKYPSIRYVLDVHRDAIETAEGGMAKPVIEKDGTKLAQVMLVVGTNEGGADHPGWKTNLCVAARLQERMMAFDQSFARPINLRSASFNQQYCPGFLLVEIGSCANTLEEAKASAEVFGSLFAALIQDP